jgi:hypothetical protein
MNQTSKEYFDKKWEGVIKQLPSGGNYRFDLRKHGYQIIVDYIEKYKKVFDFACGLGIIDKMLVDQNQNKVSGCDFSQVAVKYCNDTIDGDFKETGDIFGEHDYIIAIYFLEHIPNPVEWLKECFKHAPKVICALPNNFNRNGEHKDMQWGSWDEFNELFKDYKITRIDEGKYPDRFCAAFKHPIFVFEEKNGNKKTNKKGKRKGTKKAVKDSVENVEGSSIERDERDSDVEDAGYII